MTDAEIVACVRGGDTEAYALLVDRYRSAVYGLAYHSLRSVEDARDVAQEALVQAYRCLEQLREPARFGAWLGQITRNECRAWERRHRQRGASGEPQTVDDGVDQLVTRLAVEQALARLSEASRLTLTLFYIDAYSMREIAEFLAVPVTTIKSRLRDARARIRKELREIVEETIKPAALPEDFADQVMQRTAHPSSQRPGEPEEPDPGAAYP
jgi:RNA polymerase sigma-70 factor (ECF subfamily)